MAKGSLKDESIPRGYRYARVGEKLPPTAKFWNLYTGSWEQSKAVTQPGCGPMVCTQEHTYIIPS